MKSLKHAVFLIVVLTLVLIVPAYAQATSYTSSMILPMDDVSFNPCTGEFIHFTGRMHIVSHTSFDANGGLHNKYQLQPMGLSGTVIGTGVKYKGVGVTKFQPYSYPIGEPISITNVNNYRLIGQGPAVNFMVHQTIHITFNANEEMTANVENVKMTCK
jgi:hypothetical protein